MSNNNQTSNKLPKFEFEITTSSTFELSKDAKFSNATDKLARFPPSQFT